jgi:hypothetical protein
MDEIFGLGTQIPSSMLKGAREVAIFFEMLVKFERTQRN